MQEAGESTAWTASPTTAKRWLGRCMRAHREAAGLTVREVAALLRATSDKVSYTEAGTHAFKPRDLEGVLFPAYRVPEEDRPGLLEACRRSRLRGWWQGYDADIVPDWALRYIGLEQGATTLRLWGSLHPPGLLQAPAYTEALMFTRLPRPHEDDVAARVEVRQRRQTVLRRDPEPLAAHFVLDEAVLRRVVGGPEVMAAQATHVLAATELPDVTVQVVPFSRGPHPDTAGSFSILGFGPGDPGVVYLEGRTAEYVEDPVRIEDYASVFDAQAALALGPEESAEFIARVAATAG
jgi:hypothetical protein